MSAITKFYQIALGAVGLLACSTDALSLSSNASATCSSKSYSSEYAETTVIDGQRVWFKLLGLYSAGDARNVEVIMPAETSQGTRLSGTATTVTSIEKDKINDIVIAYAGTNDLYGWPKFRKRELALLAAHRGSLVILLHATNPTKSKDYTAYSEWLEDILRELTLPVDRVWNVSFVGFSLGAVRALQIARAAAAATEQSATNAQSEQHPTFGFRVQSLVLISGGLQGLASSTEDNFLGVPVLLLKDPDDQVLNDTKGNDRSLNDQYVSELFHNRKCKEPSAARDWRIPDLIDRKYKQTFAAFNGKPISADPDWFACRLGADCLAPTGVCSVMTPSPSVFSINSSVLRDEYNAHHAFVFGSVTIIEAFVSAL